MMTEMKILRKQDPRSSGSSNSSATSGQDCHTSKRFLPVILKKSPMVVALLFCLGVASIGSNSNAYGDSYTRRGTIQISSGKEQQERNDEVRRMRRKNVETTTTCDTDFWFLDTIHKNNDGDWEDHDNSLLLLPASDEEGVPIPIVTTTGDKSTILLRQPRRHPQSVSRCDIDLFSNYCGTWYDEPGACSCQDSTIPEPMYNEQGHPRIGDRFQAAFQKQKQRLVDLGSDGAEKTVDVVFLGDSITEHWVGEGLGDYQEKYAPIHQVFQNLFTTEGGGKVNGFVSAISGERTWNVLWRLRNNALGGYSSYDDSGQAIKLDPKVFWLLIGTNDIGGHCCSARNILEGNIAIVEELKRQRPNATVVINGILPRGHFFAKVIDPLNYQLKCYAEMMEGVEYFDATSIFTEGPHSEKTTHYSDGLHPDEEGHRIWGEAILARLLEIINK